MHALRTAAWLTAPRARAWCWTLAVMMAASTTAWLGLSRHGVDISGKPLGTDFTCFWTASQAVLSGRPADAYNPLISAARQTALFPRAHGYTGFFYPPAFLLICAPLALLPYLWSLALWVAAGWAAMVLVLRRMLPAPWARLPAVAFPAFLVNAGHGQNGCLTGLCFGLFCVLGDRAPFAAGASLGLLACKPHLLLAAPVALGAARRWRALAGLCAMALMLTGLSWLAFATPVWRAFGTSTGIARNALEQGGLGFEKMASVFAGARLLGGGVELAYAVQLAVAAPALWLMARVCVGRPGARAEGSALVAATLLCTPYLFDYDLVCLALPIAWLAREAMAGGWRHWEKIVLLASFVLALLVRPVAMRFGVPVGPFIVLALLIVVVRRAGAGLKSI